MNLRQSIKRTLSLLNKALNKVPENKQLAMINRVNTVLGKYNNAQAESELRNFSQQLQFNINFIKLAHPQIDFKEIEDQISSGQNKQKQNQQQFEFQNNSEIKKTEKIKQIPRQQVEFSNWFEGNADPEDIRRHKDLVERQYFGGDQWKGKQKPQSQTKQFIIDLLNNQGEFSDQNRLKQIQSLARKSIPKPDPEFTHDPDQRWEKVKR